MRYLFGAVADFELLNDFNSEESLTLQMTYQIHGTKWAFPEQAHGFKIIYRHLLFLLSDNKWP